MDVKNLTIRHNLMAMIIFEKVTGEAFKLDGTVTNTITYLWCMIEASNQGAISFEDFINHLNECPDDMDYLTKKLTEALASDSKIEGSKKKKKVKN